MQTARVTVLYWKVLVKIGKLFLKTAELFEPTSFPQKRSASYWKTYFQSIPFSRAHLLSILIEQLFPTAKDVTHYDRGTLNVYLDDVVWKAKFLECKDHIFLHFVVTGHGKTTPNIKI